MNIKSDTGLSILLFITNAFWGIYWLPLRHIESAGISGIWSVVCVYTVPLLFLLPLFFVRRHTLRANAGTTLLIGAAIGGGLAFYAIAFLYTTILRTTLLFYMTPIWSTLLSMIVLKEKISPRRWIAIMVGLAGVALLVTSSNPFADSGGINRGDVLALLAGVSWGLGIVLIKKSKHIGATDIVLSQYLCATLISLIVLVTTVGSSDFHIPTLLQLKAAMPYIIGFYVLIILPGLYITTRISQIISPGRVGILMMSEVLVAGISAPLVAGEVISLVEWGAGMLIVTATLIEVLSPQINPTQNN